MDNNSIKILDFLKENEDKVLFRKDLNGIFGDAILEQNIISKLIKAGLIDHENATDRIYITFEGEKQLGFAKFGR